MRLLAFPDPEISTFELFCDGKFKLVLNGRVAEETDEDPLSEEDGVEEDEEVAETFER